MWKQISDLLKESVANLEHKQIQELFREQLRIYKLLDENNIWKLTCLQSFEDKLIPEITPIQLNSFVENILQIALKNQYLKEFGNYLEREKVDFVKLKEKAKKDGSYVFPRVVIYAYILEELTVICLDNREVLEKLSDYWDSVNEKQPEYYANFSIFEKVKLASIGGVGKILIKLYRFYDPPEFVKSSFIMNFVIVSLVRLNIFEAVLEDFRLDLADNALCGISQVLQSGESKSISVIPNQFDYECWAPEHISWIDLYMTWNLAFCSHYSNFPFLFTKLLIPIVNDYYKSPKQWAIRRSTALYLYIIFLLYSRDYYLKNSPECLDWFDPELSKKWGKWNNKCAHSYLSNVAKKSPTFINEFNLKVHTWINQIIKFWN